MVWTSFLAQKASLKISWSGVRGCCNMPGSSRGGADAPLGGRRLLSISNRYGYHMPNDYEALYAWMGPAFGDGPFTAAAFRETFPSPAPAKVLSDLHRLGYVTSPRRGTYRVIPASEAYAYAAARPYLYEPVLPALRRQMDRDAG